MRAIKAVLIGDSGVGKTTIYQQLETGRFNDNSQATIGGAVTRIEAVTTDLRTVPIGLWDTAGQERYRSIIPIYFERAHFVILVYDITNHRTFDHLPEWVQLSKGRVPDATRYVLFGNKCDLAAAREVRQEEALAFAKEVGAVVSIEASAKTAEGLDVLLQCVADEAIKIKGWGLDLNEEVRRTVHVHERICC
jgi:small GTP-binding protein